MTKLERTFNDARNLAWKNIFIPKRLRGKIFIGVDEKNNVIIKKK